ncbi:MAG: XcyI family restriction endonuclease [Deltaproteobacteria bacterium]|nr:XcyI family restriction endonuclease [Deltaproteobacteria bacterium]
MSPILIPHPELQIDFSFALGQIRNTYLQEALSQAVSEIDISTLDTQLAKFVPPASIKALARHGLRGELVFPTPILLESSPHLLGYYRLLLGFSQKAFFTSEFGLTSFKSMEVKGVLTENNKKRLPELCKALIGCSCSLIEGIGTDRVSKQLLDDLTLLTVGPQLRGGANNRKGIVAIVKVFESIHKIVKKESSSSSESRIELINAAGRKVLIEFAPDPDIVIREEMSPNNYRNVVAIEVKGGTDFSNIHNRIGEAEKSHQKAKSKGYLECWTVVNVDRMDFKMAHQESPTTNRFYLLRDLSASKGAEYQDFRTRVVSLTGIKGK